MTLFEREYEPLSVLKNTGASDGEGGVATVLQTIKTVSAAVITNTATGRTQADDRRSHAQYRLTAPKGTGLKLGDLLRRQDGTLMRVTSDAIASPAPASFAFEQYDAERMEA